MTLPSRRVLAAIVAVSKDASMRNFKVSEGFSSLVMAAWLNLLLLNYYLSTLYNTIIVSDRI
jgi:hypothetical protein